MDVNGGVINGKYPFSMIIAAKQWKDMKVGSKLTFLLFDGTVRHIELHENGWDNIDEEIQIPDESIAVGYNTDERTVNGSVLQVLDGDILVVELGGDQEHNIQMKDHPEVKWKFVKGDKVSLNFSNQHFAFSYPLFCSYNFNALSKKT